jgi:hypothetical protein
LKNIEIPLATMRERVSNSLRSRVSSLAAGATVGGTAGGIIGALTQARKTHMYMLKGCAAAAL